MKTTTTMRLVLEMIGVVKYPDVSTNDSDAAEGVVLLLPLSQP